MALTPTPIRRIFLYNGRTLNDPDQSMTPEQVKLFYSAIHADLTNAVVEGGEFAGDAQTWEFKRSVGTKG
jgi:PRTRC genetic system protein C